MPQRKVFAKARLVCDPTQVYLTHISFDHLPSLRREERASPPCLGRYQSGLSWQSTPPATTASQACPSPQKGQVTWYCSQWGVWQEEGPSFSSCTDPPTLEDHIANIASAPNTAVVLEVTPNCGFNFCVEKENWSGSGW